MKIVHWLQWRWKNRHLLSEAAVWGCQGDLHWKRFWNAAQRDKVNFGLIPKLVDGEI